MNDWMTPVIATALLQNVALTWGLGVTPALAAIPDKNRALWVSLLGAPVLVLSSVLGWLLESQLLQSHGRDTLRLPILLGTTAVVAQFAVLGLQARPVALGMALPSDPARLGMHWTMLGLGLALLPAPVSFATALANGLGMALGVGLVLIPLTALMARLEVADVPAPFRRQPITLISLGIVALAYMGFNGLVKV